MNTDYANHLKALRDLHQRRLRELELKKARAGSNYSPEVQMEIDDIVREIQGIDRKLVAQQSRANEEDEYTDTRSTAENTGVPPILVIGGIFVAIVFAIFISQPTTVVSSSFDPSQGLSSWRNIGRVSLVKDDKDDNKITKGSVQLQGNPTAILYYVIEETPQMGKVYTAEAWCKAPERSTCRIFLGPVQEGLKSPLTDSDTTITRDGTNSWESLKVSFTVQEEGKNKLGIFLYAEGQGTIIIYDDVNVQRN